MTGGPTDRGARAVRHELRAYVKRRLLEVAPELREQWADEAAFPPAGPEADAEQVPTEVQTAIGRPLDRYPLVQVEVSQARFRRAATATLEGSDSIEYFVTYSVAVFVWIDVAPPESVAIEDEREYVTDVRDDLQTAMRLVFLDQAITPTMSVLPNSYAEDYGEPSAAGGQRWVVGGRSRFDLRSQERLTRPSVATVSGDEALDFDLTVGAMPPVDHPAL